MTEYFIHDRALSLCLEARRDARHAPMAAAWICRAQLWARRNGRRDLLKKLTGYLHLLDAREVAHDALHGFAV